jgi:RNA polymerase subunit RPABC4/transcription elongation factor Spt4
VRHKIQQNASTKCNFLISYGCPCANQHRANYHADWLHFTITIEPEHSGRSVTHGSCILSLSYKNKYNCKLRWSHSFSQLKPMVPACPQFPSRSCAAVCNRNQFVYCLYVLKISHLKTRSDHNVTNNLLYMASLTNVHVRCTSRLCAALNTQHAAHARCTQYSHLTNTGFLQS